MQYSKHLVAREALKTASFGSSLMGAAEGAIKKVPALGHPALVGSLAVTALSGVVAGAQAGGEHLYALYEKNKAFKEMLELHPSLRKEDESTVKRYFNSMHRANPHFMNDPSVAGALVHRVIVAQKDLGGMDRPANALATAVGELATGRAQITQAMEREHKLRPDFQQHVRSVGQAATEAFGDLARESKEEGSALKKLEAMRDKMQIDRNKETIAKQQGVIRGQEFAGKETMALLDDKVRGKLREAGQLHGKMLEDANFQSQRAHAARDRAQEWMGARGAAREAAPGGTLIGQLSGRTGIQPSFGPAKR